MKIKIFQLKGIEATNALADLTVEISNIIEDREILEIFTANSEKKQVKKNNDVLIQILGMQRMTKLLNICLKKYSDNVFNIFSIIYQENKDIFLEKNILELIQLVKNIFQDKQLTNFFQQLLN